MEDTVEELMHRMPANIKDVTDVGDVPALLEGDGVDSGSAAGKQKGKKAAKKRSRGASGSSESAEHAVDQNSKLHYILRGVRLLRPGIAEGSSGAGSGGKSSRERVVSFAPNPTAEPAVATEAVHQQTPAATDPVASAAASASSSSAA
jgi:hypothetical protein